MKTATAEREAIKALKAAEITLQDLLNALAVLEMIHRATGRKANVFEKDQGGVTVYIVTDPEMDKKMFEAISDEERDALTSPVILQ